MRHKYITLQVMLACMSKPVAQKDIHAEIAATIAERERIMQQLENLLQRAKTIEMYLSNSRAA